MKRIEMIRSMPEEKLANWFAVGDTYTLLSFAEGNNRVV